MPGALDTHSQARTVSHAHQHQHTDPPTHTHTQSKTRWQNQHEGPLQVAAEMTLWSLACDVSNHRTFKCDTEQLFNFDTVRCLQIKNMLGS